MGRIVVAGSGAMGAMIAYHLALLGADDVVVAERGELAEGSTSRAMGGVRQQFSTAAEVVLARESIEFLAGLGPQFFRQVGYLFIATTPAGLESLEERRRAQELGVELCEHTPAEELDRDVLVIACGPWSPQLAETVGVELPIRPLCRQLLRTTPIDGLPDDLPMVIEEETGFHFRRRDDRLVLAMTDPEPRWGYETIVDESLFEDRLERLARRYPPAAGASIGDAWAGLYDMTPDAHPIVGEIADGVYAACGFSGHGFMQSPAVGRALAELIVRGESSLDLSPYALERFESGAVFPEHLVL
jgi:glycine/D-amino acid oxidase-like deaminating enzyme